MQFLKARRIFLNSSLFGIIILLCADIFRGLFQCQVNAKKGDLFPFPFSGTFPQPFRDFTLVKELQEGLMGIDRGYHRFCFYLCAVINDDP